MSKMLREERILRLEVLMEDAINELGVSDQNLMRFAIEDYVKHYKGLVDLDDYDVAKSNLGSSERYEFERLEKKREIRRELK